MPYLVSRLTPRKKKIDLLDFLTGMIPLNQMLPQSNANKSGTRTTYYNYITPEKRKELNVEMQVGLLEKFYEMYSHLDFFNGNPEYNYERQAELRKYNKNDIEKVKAELEKEGLKYNSLYDTFYLPKKSSKPGHKKWRRIDAPEEELKSALTVLKNIFETLMDGCFYHTAAFAYIPGRSCKDAVDKHAQNKSNWFLKLDFSNFFGSTTKDFTIKMFKEVYPFSEICKLPNGEKALRNCLNLCFLDGGLPQGTPMSPLITNIMMIAIDHKLYNGLKEMRAIAPSGREYNYIYTRYADDIFISNKTFFNHNEVVDFVKATLKEYDAPFKLNDEKTRFTSNAGANWNLGLMLNQQHEVTVGHKRKRALKSIIHNYMEDKLRGDMWSLDDLEHLQGEISYCRSIEKDKIDEIINSYSSTYKCSVMESIKIDIKTLRK